MQNAGCYDSLFQIVRMARTAVMRDTLNLLTSTQTTKEGMEENYRLRTRWRLGPGGKSRRKLDFEDCLR